MSYILDALRKADGERRRGRVPTLDAIHALPATRGSRAWWPWLVALVLVLNAAGLAWVVRLRPTAGAPGPARAAVGPATAATAPGPPAEPKTGLASSDEETPPPFQQRSETPAPGAAARPAAPPRTASQEPAAERPIAQSPLPAVPAPPRPPAPPLPVPAAPSPPSGAVPIPAPTPATATPALPRAAPPAPAVQPAPAAQPAREPAVALGDAVRALSLDVLVYSEVEEQRMVFINSRKYVEGQRVDGKLLVEAITPEGAVLAYQGQRYLLRPKTNPYVR